MNAVLAVTQPENCGVGGDIFCLYYEAATGRVHFLNGSGRSGSRASLDELRRRGMDRLPVIGPATVSVPGCVRGWAMLLERFGTRPLGELLQPAIHYASRGFPMTSLLSQTIRGVRAVQPRSRVAADLRAWWPAARRSASSWRSPIWAARSPTWPPRARTSSIAGASVEAIARRMEAEGFLTADGSGAHTASGMSRSRRPIAGCTVYETPPPTQGLAALLGLNMLEGFALADLRCTRSSICTCWSRSSKLAYADRDRWIGDPAHARVPVAALLSQGLCRASARATSIRRRRSPTPSAIREGDTTGFVVADGHGNLISVIQSLFNAFGSGVVAPGTGVVLQNRGRHFSTRPVASVARSRRASVPFTR